MASELPSSRLNPYTAFQSLQPDEMIDYGVLVYHGSFHVAQAAAMSRVQHAQELMRARKPDEALAMAREAATLCPQDVEAQNLLGNLAAHFGHKDEARTAWQAALAAAKQLEPDAGAGYIADIDAKLKKL